MKVYLNPEINLWAEICQRPAFEQKDLDAQVFDLMDQVRLEGDAAVKRLSKRFDGVALESLLIPDEAFSKAEKALPEALKGAIRQAAANIERFHAAQLRPEEVVETMPGVRCWRKSVGIQKVGLYIPGGTAPLFSTVLMLGIPAKLAGCKEVLLCSPPNAAGELHPAILYAASVCGIRQVYAVGGVQAIAAMTYGTETIPQVDKLFGPGNQYVTAAKQLAQRSGVAIDMPAGPSEVAIFADETADPAFIAADLLSQAEHGADSQVLLVTNSEQQLEQVQAALEAQLQRLPRLQAAAGALANSRMVYLPTADQALELLNAYAPEHLILNCRDAATLAGRLQQAGSVFIGAYSCESAGDYASGTNHTLPTNGYARAYSGVSVDSFVKKITFQELSAEGARLLAPTVELMAAAEQLDAHRYAMQLRREKAEAAL
ncbi:MAG: histidinol dehydrogenase [Sphingobacteriaceae bacterium]|nr:histidinol dehydrogenase [Sphingobacteriaceae bacterium]